MSVDVFAYSVIVPLKSDVGVAAGLVDSERGSIVLYKALNVAKRCL